MSFTDEDMRRLMEYRNKYQYFNVPTAWDVNAMYDLVDGIIARLEAAEGVVKEAQNILHGPKDNSLRVSIACGYQYCDDSHELDIDGALDVWRKAAGK